MSREVPGFQHLRRGRVELWVDPAWAPAVAALDLLAADTLARALAGAGGGGGRGGTLRLPLAAGAELLLRPCLHGGLLGPLRGGLWLGAGRARRELEVTARLRAAGAPVPRPILAAAWRRAGPLWGAAVGTGFEADARDALALLRAGPDESERLAAAAAAGRAVRAFHDAGGSHADLHLGNLLLRERGGAWEALVIDLDRARCLPAVSASRRMAELARLYRSLVKRGLAHTLGAQGAGAFLAGYVGDDRALGEALARHLGRERRRLRLHALRYPRAALR